MDQAEADVLVHLHFPPAHWVKLLSTNTLERLNKEVKRRAMPWAYSRTPPTFAA